MPNFVKLTKLIDLFKGALFLPFWAKILMTLSHAAHWVCSASGMQPFRPLRASPGKQWFITNGCSLPQFYAEWNDNEVWRGISN